MPKTVDIKRRDNGLKDRIIYAKTLPADCTKEAGKIIPPSFWLDDKNFDALFVKDGTAENYMDAETRMIQNKRIDEISKVINREFDELLDLQIEEGRHTKNRKAAH